MSVIKTHEVTVKFDLNTKLTTTVKLQLEAFFQHPISESWTFHTGGLSYQPLPMGNITDSPIIDQADSTHVMMGVLYVF